MVTLATIAKRCGVSKMTVSRALGNQSDKVAEHKREEIIRVARQYNYRRNRLAKSFNTGKTNLIAYLTGEFRHYQSNIFAGIQSVLVPNDYDMLVLQWSKILKKGDRLLRSIVDRRVDGVMLFHEGPDCDYSYLNEFHDHKIPVVVLDRDVNVSTCGYVGHQNYSGAIEATNHLLELGHRSIIFLCREEDSSFSTTSARYAGFQAALKEKGLMPAEPVVIPADIVKNKDLDAFAKMICNRGITAILADNDVVAFFCICGLTIKGFQIPDDVSVVGFGNVQGYADLIRPELTTMDLDPKRLGIKASNLLLSMIENKSQRQEKIIRTELPMNLIIRNSTARI